MFRLMRWLRLIPLLIVLLTLGCASTPDDEFANMSAQELYDKAKKALKKKMDEACGAGTEEPVPDEGDDAE